MTHLTVATVATVLLKNVCLGIFRPMGRKTKLLASFSQQRGKQLGVCFLFNEMLAYKVIKVKNHII